jgi:hypothetical protein
LCGGWLLRSLHREHKQWLPKLLVNDCIRHLQWLGSFPK